MPDTDNRPWVEVLFSPRSVVVLGASDNSTKWGNTMAQGALDSPGDRTVLLVNRRAAQVLGQTAYRTAVEASSAQGADADLAVICVPAASFLDAVQDSVDAGARAIVGITVGLSETGAEGAALEKEALRIAREAGARLLGPNGLGVADTHTGLQLAHDVLLQGDVAVITQSGNLGLDLAALLADRGVGISRFVSLGNQSDLNVVDFLWASVDHEHTRAVAIYSEDVVDGRGFLAAAQALHEAGKPLVMLSPFRTAAAVRTAASHTGSLTTSSMVIDAACAATGAHRADHPTHQADLLVALRAPQRMSGRRTAVLTDGGGHGAVGADALAMVGLSTPMFTESTLTELTEAVWEHATVTNPVDLAGGGEKDTDSYARVVQALLTSSQADGVLLTGYFGGYTARQSGLAVPELIAAQRIADLVAAQSKPLVLHTIYPDSATSQLLHDSGIPVHRDVDRACAVLAGLVQGDNTGLGLPVPPPAAPVTDVSYAASRALFAEAGVRFPVAIAVSEHAELEAAFDAPGMTFPVVLKATGALHKSDGGGVVLGLADREQARAAYDDIVARLAPPSVSVEAMADLDAGVELILGSVHDPRFGAVVMVGLGGVFTEVLGDTACAVAPVTVDAARELLLSLRGAPLLLGARGRQPADVDSLADLVVRVASLAAAHPELRELELNPVLAGPDGTLALDARIVL